MITGMAVDTMVWSRADSRKTIITPMMVIFFSASVKVTAVDMYFPRSSPWPGWPHKRLQFLRQPF